MAGYKLISLDVLTNVRVAEVPLSDLKWGWSYDSGLIIGHISGTLTLPEATNTRTKAYAALLNDACTKYRRHLFLEKDGEVVCDGIIWGNVYEPESRSRQITAGSTVTYFNRRFIGGRQSFAGVDQLIIARTLIAAALAEPNGNPGITMGAETCGRLRDRTYESWDVKNLGEALEELCSLEDGFDLAIDCSWNPATGAPIKTLRLHYPRRGRDLAHSGHVFELGRNAVFEWPEGAEMANRVYGIGQGAETDMLLVTRTDSASLSAGYPLLEGTYANKSVSDTQTLVDQTQADLDARTGGLELPRLIITSNRDPQLGSYIVGDACKVRAQPGADPGYPNGLEVYRRISDIAVEVSDEGAETIIVDTMEEP